MELIGSTTNQPHENTNKVIGSTTMHHYNGTDKDKVTSSYKKIDSSLIGTKKFRDC